MTGIESIIEKARTGSNLCIDHDIEGYTVKIDNEVHLVPWSKDAKLHIEEIRLAHKKPIIEDYKYADDLIFGKDKREEVVALEIEDDEIVLYYNDGEVEKLPMVYWILAPIKLDKHYKRLDGDLHYKYVRTFSSFGQFRKYSNIYKHKEMDVFRIWNAKEQAMIYHGITMFKGLKVKDVSVLSFDIETNGLTRDADSKVFLITNTFRGSDGSLFKKHFRLDHYETDTDMIEDWCNWLVEIDPTILTGHNITGFDMPFLQHCYAKRDGHKRTLPIGKFSHEVSINKFVSQFRVDGATTWDYNKIQIPGRHLIDGMFLSVRYDIGRNFPSWGLKPIAEYLGIINEDRQFYDASQIGKNWDDPVEREKIIAYGVDDSDDSLAIYDIMIPSIFYFTQSIPKPFQLMTQSASGAQLNAVLVRAYLQEGYSISKASERETVGGGISFGIPGIHSNVFKIDVISLYPSIIRSKQLYSKKKDPKAYYLKMVDTFTEERLKNKRLFKETGDSYYNDLQASQKVGINSAYGLCGTSGLNFNDFAIANEITKTGRQIIKDSIMWATGKDIFHWFPDYDITKDEL
jgi:DNA polymerase elongation subunit (family B)